MRFPAFDSFPTPTDMKVFPRALALSVLGIASATAPLAAAQDLSEPILVPPVCTDATGVHHARDVTLASLPGEGRLALSGAIRVLQEQINGLPTNDELRQRVMAALDHLASRSSVAYVGAHDLALLRHDLAAAKLDRAIRVLEARAEASGWTEQQFRAVAMGWLARADAFVDSPNPAAYRARTMSAIERALLTASGIAESVRAMRLQLLELQLQAAIMRLRLAREDGSVSAYDHDRLLAIYVARARAAQ